MFLNGPWPRSLMVLASAVALNSAPISAPALAQGDREARWRCDRSPLVVTRARLWTDAGVQSDREVLIVSGRVAAVARAGSIKRPKGTRVIDANGDTLLPGLIDSHAHFFELPRPAPGLSSPIQSSLPTTAKQTLRSGVTTARAHLFDLVYGPALQRAAADDCYPSPRLSIAGPGFMGGSNEADEQTWGASSADEAREKVRRIDESGAEWIAIHGAHQFAPGVLASLVDEARKRGLRVLASGASSEEVLAMSQLPVDSYEYLLGRDADRYPPTAIAALKRSGAAVVTPIGYYRRDIAHAADPRLIEDDRLYELMAPAEAARVRKELREEVRNPEPYDRKAAFAARVAKFRQLRDAGIPIAVATDSGSTGQFHIDAIWWDLETWRQIGVPAVETITAATARPARLLGRKDIGALKAGARGDFVLYRDDYSAGAFEYGRVRAVAKGGVLYVAEGKWVGP